MIDGYTMLSWILILIVLLRLKLEFYGK
jgi:hypothetical protein